MDKIHKLDHIIANQFPTIMMPKYGNLPPISPNKTRLIMHQSGLALESNPTWGKLNLPLWKSPKKLPYGELKFFAKFPNQTINSTIRSAMRHDASKHSPQEFAAGVYFNQTKNTSRYIECEAIERGVGHIHYQQPSITNDESLLIDIHSHGAGHAYFSATDDIDDQGGVKLAVVLGCCGKNQSMEFKIRLCVEGYFFDEQDIPDLKKIMMGEAHTIEHKQLSS